MTTGREPGAGGVPPGELPEEDKGPKFTSRDLEAIVDPTFLEHLTQASGGFSYHIIKQKDVPEGVMTNVGFTVMRTRQIFLIQEALKSFLEKPGGERKLKGFLAHEGGHHTPWVLALDRMLREHIGEAQFEPTDLNGETEVETPEILSDHAYWKRLKAQQQSQDELELEQVPEPEEAQTPDHDRMPIRQLYWRAVASCVFNGALDVWLEQYMGREPFVTLRGDYPALHD